MQPVQHPNNTPTKSPLCTFVLYVMCVNVCVCMMGPVVHRLHHVTVMYYSDEIQKMFLFNDRSTAANRLSGIGIRYRICAEQQPGPLRTGFLISFRFSDVVVWTIRSIKYDISGQYTYSRSRGVYLTMYLVNVLCICERFFRAKGMNVVVLVASYAFTKRRRRNHITRSRLQAIYQRWIL